MADDVMVDEAEVEAPPIPDTTELETRLEARMEHLGRELRNQISNISVAGEVVPPMSLHRAMAELLVTVAKAPGEKRALADVIGTAPGNASGLRRDRRIPRLRVWARLPADHTAHPRRQAWRRKDGDPIPGAHRGAR
jgi:hypothetical protein